MNPATQNPELLAYLADLRQRAATKKRIESLRHDNGIEFYRPHAKQDKFHLSPATGRYMRFGNRGGKSECGIVETLSTCLGQRLFYRHAFDVLGVHKGATQPDGLPLLTKTVARHHPGGLNHPAVTSGLPIHPVKALLIVVDWDMAKRIFTNREGSYETWGKIFKFLPREAVGKVHISRGGHVDQIEIKRPTAVGGGSSTLSIDTVQSFKNNRLSAESADWDYIHVDEPCPEKLFTAHARGLMDRQGRFQFNCTPLDEMWMNDRFTPPGGKVTDNYHEGRGFTTLKGANRFIITGDIFDNPHITRQGILEYMADLSRDEISCRIYGLPLAMAGMVYKEFSSDEHVYWDCPWGGEDFHLPPKDWTHRVAWDVHGARLPQAVLLEATAPDGTAYIYDEMFFEPLIGPNAELLKEKLDGRNVVSHIIDPRALIINPVTETADVLEALMEHGLYFDAASKDLTAGISAVKTRLKERHVVTGLPTLRFSPNLTETLFEFSHYVYDLEKNKPKDENDHMMENLYRLVLNGLDHIAPVSDEEYTHRRRTFIRPNEDLRPFSRS